MEKDRLVASDLTIILVEPQLGWNIGSVARVMLNYGLTDLRLVNPRDGWPNPDSEATAAGADVVLERAQVYPTLMEAMADLNIVYAATVRPHDMHKPVYAPRQGVEDMFMKSQAGAKVAIAFGGESSGLVGEDVSLCEGIITVPTNPDFSSLNLAHAVGVMAYEWGLLNQKPRAPTEEPLDIAPRKELNLFIEHLEAELDKSGFLQPAEKRPRMVKNIRNIFTRIQPTQQEVRTLRGIVRYLTRDYG